MSFKDPLQSLQDILDNIARIERFLHGCNFEAFVSDEEKIYAVQYALQVIGEAAVRLGHQAETLCPGIPWRDIRGIRNWLSHGYDDIDLAQIWGTVTDDLPLLKSAVTQAVPRMCTTDSPEADLV